MYEALVFDADGVLVRADHLPVHRRAVRQAFAAHGVADPAPEDVEAMALDVTLGDLRRVAEEYGFDPAAFWRTRDMASSSLQIDAVGDGLKQPYGDVGVLRELDVPKAVVSTNQQATLEHLLERFDLAELFVGVHGRAPTLVDVVRKKPAPFFVTRAMTDLERARGDGRLDPERVLMVGDSESDVRAANAAGIDAAFVRRDHRDEYTLSVAPDHEIDDLHALVQLLADD